MHRAALPLLCVPLFALMAPTGGYPTNPQFQSVKVSGQAIVGVVVSPNVSASVLLSQAGWRVQRSIIGTAGGVGTCAIGGAGVATGFTTCSRNSAGNYTVNISSTPGFTSINSYQCISNTGSASVPVSAATPQGSFQLGLTTFTAGGVATDIASVQIICVGS